MREKGMFRTRHPGRSQRVQTAYRPTTDCLLLTVLLLTAYCPTAYCLLPNCLLKLIPTRSEYIYEMHHFHWLLLPFQVTIEVQQTRHIG